MRQNRLLAVLMFVLSLFLVAVPVAYAAYNNEPFESEPFPSSGADGKFSLSYLGTGGGKCDWLDYRFRVNVNRSYTGSDWKFFSGNSYYQRTPSGRPIYGHDLNTSNAHICIGAKEFSSWYYPRTAWNGAGVQNNIYTWRR